MFESLQLPFEMCAYESRLGLALCAYTEEAEPI